MSGTSAPVRGAGTATPRGAGAGETVAERRRGGAGAGYAMVSGSYVIMGSIGVLVAWTTAPESALLVVRFVTAGLVLGAVFARRRPWAGIRRPGIPARLLVMGLVDSFTLLLFFVALRDTSVAIGMFLCFLAPVWVAVIAPRVFHSRTEPAVYLALLVAVTGLAVILAPTLFGEGVHASALGVAAGVGAGVGYATFQMIAKGLTNRGVGSVTLVMSEMVVDTVVLLPLALWQTVGAGYQMTSRDLIAGVILGVVCTAFGYTLWTEGQRRIPVQHASLLGYLEPVSAPVYALVLLGQSISGWTIAGGALICVAGALVILFGEREGREGVAPL